MAEFTIKEMQEMQKELQEKYKDKWEPICPEIGQNKLLWMIGEIGEVRLSKVLNLLKLTAKSEEAIASECGYGSLGTLRNVFRSRFGTTMRAWRMKLPRSSKTNEKHSTISGVRPQKE